jgi:hypothetical protein
MLRRLLSFANRRRLERQRALVWDAFQNHYDRLAEQVREKHGRVSEVESRRRAHLHAALGRVVSQ